MDHGKTVLIKSLTGVDTDRLKEEKERGISIELGFAYLTLENGQKAGIIDVPGHERFIKNMLAGVGGMDLVLLVIAADEGVMPQTREHLDIIQLLNIQRGIVVITKKDLVDEEWLAMVYEDVTDFIKGTTLEKAPVLSVAAVKREGLDELLKEINKQALEVEQQNRQYTGQPRLPVDRVFTMTGFGTVATGTLLSGKVHVGDNLQVYPTGGVYRVRNLQVHGQKVDVAEAGQRVAINLSGLESGALTRGQVLAVQGSLQPTHRLDIKLAFLSSAPKPLKHRTRVRVYLGAAEVLGRVVLLDREELQPGEEAYIQLQMEEPVAAAKGDHMVLRSYSPMRTIGGGMVVDPFAIKHKRYREELIQALNTAENGSPDELLEQYLSGTGKFCSAAELIAGTGMTGETVHSALPELLDQGHALCLSFENEKMYVSTQMITNWEVKIKQALSGYHNKYPLREGYPKEELRSRLFTSMNNKQFQMALLSLECIDSVELYSNSVAASGFIPAPGASVGKAVQHLEELFLANPYQPPGWAETAQEAGITKDDQEVLNYLLNRGVLVKIADGMYFHEKALAEILALVRGHFQEKGELLLGELRDLLQTSRKYALPLLEYMDREKITRRIGDVRYKGSRF